MRNFYLLCLYLIAFTGLRAQVSTIPVFPTAGPNDSVTIVYDATQGNAALVGTSPVYMHSGVITNLSATSTSWLHVQGNWGTADPNVLMTNIGNNLWSKKIHIRNFYGVAANETVQKMAFVFRNAAGTTVGRTTSGGDIFVDVYSSTSSLLGRFTSPASGTSLLKNLGDQIAITANTNLTGSTITLYDNSTQLSQTTGNVLNYTLNVNAIGNHKVLMTATNGSQSVRDSFTYVVTPSINIQDAPVNTEYGINYINDSTVTLRLYAPQKQNVYVIGSFNNWSLSTQYLMNKSVDGTNWWLTISHLPPNQYQTYQYFVDGTIKVADPHSELVLDPSNDSYIPSVTFPNMPPYPTGHTTGIVTAIRPGEAQYQWTNNTFNAPAKTDLVLYELLVRDFIARHDYQTLRDTLSYLHRLGVNAIQLMPVSEFDGNLSWGYNPNFHMALDKYYGTKDNFKAFVDACHGAGIAVVLDVVYNHVYGLSPLTALYWDAANNQPAANNPWLNPVARHPFNIGYDVNHESPATHIWLDRIMTYWINEYHIDGFRFDLAKGFTQTNSGSNVGLWAQYDASRIVNVKRIYDVCHNANPNFYAILEYFADNSEETVLSNYGCMIWGNGNCAYNQATMGYASGPCSWDFTWGVSYQNRGWNSPNLVSYMESHDEERLMYKNFLYGNANTGIGYNIKDTTTALKRMELAHALFFTIPGPKMLYEFQELGYGYSVNYCANGTVNSNCRTDAKPIRWNYQTEQRRKRLYDVTKALIYLKQNYAAFKSTNFNTDLAGGIKSVRLNGSNSNAIAIGNFDVSVNNNVTPNFQHTGWWYEYFTGDSIQVSNTGMTMSLAQGEYRVYTDHKVQAPVIASVPELVAGDSPILSVYPNPSSTGDINLELLMPQGVNTISNQLALVQVIDLTGRVVYQQSLAPGQINTQISGLQSGMYIVTFTQGNLQLREKVIVNH